MKAEKDKRTGQEMRTETATIRTNSKKDNNGKNDRHESNLLKLPPLTSPNDANTDPWTLDSLLQQSYHLISMLRMSMSSWIIASEVSRNKKIQVTRRYEIPTVAIEMPLEIILSKSRILEYMELCSSFGMTSIEYWNGHPDAVLTPREVVKLAGQFELDVLARVMSKRGAENDRRRNSKLLDESKEWLDSGAKYLVADPFETSPRISSPKSNRRLSKNLAENLVSSFGLHPVMFEATVIESQTYLIDRFGPEVRLCGVRLEDLLEVESYRRQPYSGFFGGPKIGTYITDLDREQYVISDSQNGTKKDYAGADGLQHQEK